MARWRSDSSYGSLSRRGMLEGMSRTLIRRLRIVPVLLAAWVTSASATVTVTPASPTPADTIRVQVDDGFPTGRQWTVVSTSCREAAPDSLVITTTLQYCNGLPGCFGTANPTAFRVTCPFPPRPAGIYRAVYVERYLNPNDPRPADLQYDPTPRTVRFEVTAPTAMRRRAWGRVKALYR